MQPNITFLDRSVIVEIVIILECGEYVHYYLVVMILIRIEESTGMYDSIFLIVNFSFKIVGGRRGKIMIRE